MWKSVILEIIDNSKSHIIIGLSTQSMIELTFASTWVLVQMSITACFRKTAWTLWLIHKEVMTIQLKRECAKLIGFMFYTLNQIIFHCNER